MSTESVLREWRYGQAQAERLAAALLLIEGYTDVDPQHPLGGPDGLKDVLCRRGPQSFVAAAHFPTTPPTTAALAGKFRDDLAGVAKNNADGFCFFVNQHITIGNRTILQDLAGDTQVEIYHLERIRALLDSAQGCGVRLEYLRIPMSEEEQFAFWSGSNYRLSERLTRLEMLQQQTYDAILSSSDSMMSRTNLMFSDLRQQISSTLQPDYARLSHVGAPPTAHIDAALLCWLHRLILGHFGAGAPLAVGTFRNNDVWVGALYKGAPTFNPPPFQEVPSLVEAWAKSWRDEYETLRESDRDSKITGITSFYYELLRIHPFIDGNGRVADRLLDQAARELLQRTVLEHLGTDRSEHFQALFAANAGDFAPLRARIAAALS